MARFGIAPQWQGSSSSRAMQLIDGAEAIAGDLPRAATVAIEAPAEAGDAQGTKVLRASALARMRERIHDTVAAVRGEHAVTIGGDCGVALGAVSATAGDDLAIVWIDAHADLHTPESSPSGAFHGMVLRAILGDGVDPLRLRPGIPPSHIVLAGTRALDDDEQGYIDEHGIRMVPASELADPDVLEPAEISGVALPEPFGARAADVVASIRRLRERLPLAGATITEFSPASPAAAVDDLGTILRLVGALA